MSVAQIIYKRKNPDNLMYRGRLSEELNHDAKEYVSSTESDKKIQIHDIQGTRVHVLMLYKIGMMPKKDAVNILSVLSEANTTQGISEKEYNDAEDGHELLEAYVARQAGESGGSMHAGRSRNDQVALAIRLKLRADTIIIQRGILALAEVLLRQAESNTGTRVPLYTHLQHAQPGLLSHYMIAYMDALLRDYHRFQDMYARINASPLGAGPVAGSSLPIDRLLTAEMLAFPSIVENSLDATGTRDGISEFVSCVALMMVNLSRMAEDFVLWSSDEFSFIELGDDVSSPSSAMPQKKNPDVMELTRGKAARAIGDLTSVLAIQKGLASGYGRDLQETKEPAWSSSSNAQGALSVMMQVIEGMKINRNRMGKSAHSNSLLALGIAEELVRRGVSFRDAHRVVGALVQKAHAMNKRLGDMNKDEIEEACDLDAAIVLDAILHCVKSDVVSYTSIGSASVEQQHHMIKHRRIVLARLCEMLEQQQTSISQGMSKTDKEIEALLSQPAE